MRKLIFTLGILLGCAPLSVAGSYYIDCVNGLDSNNGTATTTPWQHNPYDTAQIFSGSYSAAAGDKFYYRGGITCTDVAMKATQGGSSTSNVEYFGPDPSHTWYSGGSWTRPIWDENCAEAGTTDIVFDFKGSYETLDDIEITNVWWSNSVSTYLLNFEASNNITLSNTYWHHFCPAANLTNSVIMVGGNDPGTDQLLNNTVDGSDNCSTTACGAMVEFTHGNCCATMNYNVVHDVTTFVNTASTNATIAYNTFYNLDPYSACGTKSPGCVTTLHTNNQPFLCGSGGTSLCDAAALNGVHPDSIQLQGSGTANIHDNWGADWTAEGIDLGNMATSYVLNNVFVHVLSGTAVWHFGNANTIYALNNTLECDGQTSSISTCWQYNPGTAGTVYVGNNTYITPSGGGLTNAVCMGGAGGYGTGSCVAPATLHQCAGMTGGSNGNACELALPYNTAATDGQSNTQTPYIYQPLTGSDPQVGIGVNLTSLCSSTVLACTDSGYGASGNPPAEARTPTSRPSTGAWTAGALNQSTSGPPSPPTGLTVTITAGNGVLNWTAGAGASTYSVYRSTSPTPCTNGSTVYASGISSTSYTDTAIVAGVNYFYQVLSVNGSGSSACTTASELVVPPTYPVWSFSNLG